MIGAVIECLAVVILIAGAVVVLIALAIAGMLGIVALRVLRNVHKILGWLVPARRRVSS